MNRARLPPALIAGVLSATVALHAGKVWGVDGVVLEAGAGLRHTHAELYRLGLVSEWRSRVARGRYWRLGSYWEADLGRWRLREPVRTHRHVSEVGIAAVFRWEALAGPVRLYGDAGVGLQWLSNHRSGNSDLSTHVQFSPRLGVGIILHGDAVRWEVGYEYLHMSNAGVAVPNPGVDFGVLRVAVRF